MQTSIKEIYNKTGYLDHYGRFFGINFVNNVYSIYIIIILLC